MKTKQEGGDAIALASTLSQRLQDFLSPLLIGLDRVLDRRLVKTFAATLSILLEQRYQDLLGEEAEAWKHARGQKTRSRRQIWDAHHYQFRSGGVLALPVRHPAYPGPLWLVVSRRGKGHEPWYLLTNEVCETPKQMWRIVFAHARRWQIEMSFRFTKSELARESPRLWFWENRLKLLQMVSLAYAFPLSLLQPELQALRAALLRGFCPRTGKRSREVSTPLYRLRAAICILYMSLRTPLLPQLQGSG